MGQECFICKKGLGKLAIKFKISDLQFKKIPIPDGMTDEDRVCKNCYNNEKRKLKELKKQLKEQASRDNKKKGGFSMKSTYLAIIVIIAVGVIILVVAYQPYGECIAMNKDLQEQVKLIMKVADKLGTQNEVFIKLSDAYDLNKEEYYASCRPLM